MSSRTSDDALRGRSLFAATHTRPRVVSAMKIPPVGPSSRAGSRPGSRAGSRPGSAGVPPSRASAGSGNDVGTVNGSRSSSGRRPGSGRGATATATATAIATATATARPAGVSRPSSGARARANASAVSRGAPSRVVSASDPPSTRDEPLASANPNLEADDDEDRSARLTTEELERQIADLRRRIAEDDAASSDPARRARVFAVAAPPDDSTTDADADADADAFVDDLREGTLDDRRLAVAREDALDGLIDTLARARSKPTDKAMLEIEEREADRARLRVDLTTYLHRLKRDPRVEFPADFARVAGDVYKATKMREELRATGKITLASAGDHPDVGVPGGDGDGEDRAAAESDAAEAETLRRKIAEGLARIARLDEKLRLHAVASRAGVDSSPEDAEETKRREAMVAARSARRREKLAKLRRALRGDDAAAMEGPAARNAVGAFARRFLRLSPEEDALAERLLAAFDAAGGVEGATTDAGGEERAGERAGERAATTAAKGSARERNPFEPPPPPPPSLASLAVEVDRRGGEGSDSDSKRARDDAASSSAASSSAAGSSPAGSSPAGSSPSTADIFSDAGGDDASFGARLAAIDDGLRAFARAADAAPGGYFRSASRASSRPASAAASDVSVSERAPSVVAASDRSGSVRSVGAPPSWTARAGSVVDAREDERLRAAEEEVDRRLRRLKTTDAHPERLDADEMATLVEECRRSLAADARGGE